MLSTLTPAYNRDYQSKKQVIQDFLDNKDFILQNIEGYTYINRQDIEKIGEKEVMVRYKKLTKVTILKFSPKNNTWK